MSREGRVVSGEGEGCVRGGEGCGKGGGGLWQGRGRVMSREGRVVSGEGCGRRGLKPSTNIPLSTIDSLSSCHLCIEFFVSDFGAQLILHCLRLPS